MLDYYLSPFPHIWRELSLYWSVSSCCMQTPSTWVKTLSHPADNWRNYVGTVSGSGFVSPSDHWSAGKMLLSSWVTHSNDSRSVTSNLRWIRTPSHSWVTQACQKQRKYLWPVPWVSLLFPIFFLLVCTLRILYISLRQSKLSHTLIFFSYTVVALW